MHVISFKRLREFWQRYPESEEPLRRWYKIVTKAQWQNFADTRQDFSHADLVGVCTVFNIKGNDYRLISKIYYPSQTMLVRFVLTHAEYDKEGWKNDCYC